MRKRVFLIIAFGALVLGLLIAYWLIFGYNSLYAVERVFSILIGILVVVFPVLSLVYARNMESEDIFNHKRNIFFLVVNIVIVIAALIVIPTGFRVDVFQGCDRDCNRVCDLDAECCYADSCIPTACDRGGKDVEYYRGLGLTPISEISGGIEGFGTCF